MCRQNGATGVQSGMAPTLWSTMAPVAVAMSVLLFAQGQQNPGNEALLDRFQNTSDFGLQFDVRRQIAQAGDVEPTRWLLPSAACGPWEAAYGRTDGPGGCPQSAADASRCVTGWAHCGSWVRDSA